MAGVSHPPGLAARVGWLACILAPLMLAGCAGTGSRDVVDDGDPVPPHIARIPDAVPKVEPLSRHGNPESYTVFGKRYRTQKNSRGHVERGLASWYGEPFHGRRTSSGETYDMHAMTAAHKTLPLPTYAQVTNLDNGRSIVVKINDRGPFHEDRVIDLSYTAAMKLGVVRHGTAPVEVKAIDPAQPRSAPASGPFLARRDTTPATRTPAPAPVARPTPAAPATPPPATALARVEPRPAAKPVAPPATSLATPPAPARVADARPPAATSTLFLQIGAFGNQDNAERLRDQVAGNIADAIEIEPVERNGLPLYRVHVGPLASARDAERLSRQLAALGIDSPRQVVR